MNILRRFLQAECAYQRHRLSVMLAALQRLAVTDMG